MVGTGGGSESRMKNLPAASRSGGVVRIIWHGMNEPDYPAQDKTLAIFAGVFYGLKIKKRDRSGIDWPLTKK